jgi:hypothetical protein
MTDRNLRCDHLPAAHPEQALQQTVGEQALGLACLMHLTRACFAKLQADWGSEMAPLLALQQACVESYAREHGVDQRDVDAALTALLVAGGRRGPGGSLN